MSKAGEGFEDIRKDKGTETIVTQQPQEKDGWASSRPQEKLWTRAPQYGLK